MTLQYHHEATDELKEAVALYRGRDPQLAQDFLVELDRQLDRIEANPSQFPSWRRGSQRALLRRFPYQIIFQHIEADLIMVYAVSHQHRDPEHWTHRL